MRFKKKLWLPLFYFTYFFDEVTEYVCSRLPQGGATKWIRLENQRFYGAREDLYQFLLH